MAVYMHAYVIYAHSGTLHAYVDICSSARPPTDPEDYHISYLLRVLLQLDDSPVHVAILV